MTITGREKRGLGRTGVAVPERPAAETVYPEHCLSRGPPIPSPDPRKRRSAMPGKATATGSAFPRLYPPNPPPTREVHAISAANLTPAERDFLLGLQRDALQYFLDNQTPAGLTLDRQSNHGPRRAFGLCSTSA